MIQSDKLGAGLLTKVPTILAEDNQLLGIQCTVGRHARHVVLDCVHNHDARQLPVTGPFIGELWIRTKKTFVLDRDSKILLCNLGLHTMDCYEGLPLIPKYHKHIKDTPWRHALFVSRALKDQTVDPTIVFPNVVSCPIVLNPSDWEEVFEEYLANVAISLLKGRKKTDAYAEKVRFEWTDPSCIPLDDHLVSRYKLPWLKTAYLKNKKKTNNSKPL